jgi:amidase
MTDLCFEPAHRLAKMLRERAVSAEELLRQFESRVASINPSLNAIIATDFDAARRRAREADAALSRGEWWGPLHGLPMTIKDTYEVAGLPTVCGAPALKGYRPKTNAIAVQRLLDAGANVFGKTNVPMYAGDIQTYNKVFGVTRNPWNFDRTPGGSSGGAAAALAAGLTALEFGSDLAGSIRIPAHFCGLFGHKPSSGLVSMRGHIPGPPGTIAEPDLAIGGPLARSAEDLALALRLAAGPTAPAATAWRLELPEPALKLAGLRVHAWLDDAYCPVESEVRGQLEQALAKLTAAGCRVSTGAPAGFSLEEMYRVYSQLMAGLFCAGLPPKTYRRAWLAARLARWFGLDRPNTLPWFLAGATQSHRDWMFAHEKRERLRLKFEEFFGGADVLLMPVTATRAPPHAAAEVSAYKRTIAVNGADVPYTTQFTWISPATLAGLPATAVPVGVAAGLPVGMQVAAAHGRDLATIEFSRQLAELCGSGALRPPEPGEPRAQAPAR